MGNHSSTNNNNDDNENIDLNDVDVTDLINTKNDYYEKEICIIGDSGVGKTNLINKLFDKDFRVDDTIIGITQWSDDNNVVLNSTKYYDSKGYEETNKSNEYINHILKACAISGKMNGLVYVLTTGRLLQTNFLDLILKNLKYQNKKNNFCYYKM